MGGSGNLQEMTGLRSARHTLSRELIIGRSWPTGATLLSMTLSGIRPRQQRPQQIAGLMIRDRRMIREDISPIGNGGTGQKQSRRQRRGKDGTPRGITEAGC